MPETPAIAPADWHGRTAPGRWRVSRERALTLDRPRLLAILNITPDSFSDGGEYLAVDAALARANQIVEQGAAMLDIGGESTRPGAAAVPIDEQIRRVVPAIRAIRASHGAARDIPISIDTTWAKVAEAAIDAGADGVNDQSAGRDDTAMLPLVSRRGAGLILMHRLRPSRSDAYSTAHPSPPDYRPEGVVARVRSFLRERAQAALNAGIAAEAIVLDPGLGFGKDVEQNMAIVRSAADFVSLGFPILCAASRKSFLGGMGGTGLRPVMAGDSATQADVGAGSQHRSKTGATGRVAASVAVAVTQYLAGVRLFRVHDVPEHAQALSIVACIGR